MVAVGSRLTWNEGPVFGGGTLEKTSTDGPIDEKRMQASEPAASTIELRTALLGTQGNVSLAHGLVLNKPRSHG
jgi:hypothetical protein